MERKCAPSPYLSQRFVDDLKPGSVWILVCCLRGKKGGYSRLMEHIMDIKLQYNINGCEALTVLYSLDAMYILV